MNGKILSTIRAEDFIGRTRETEMLRRHAQSESETRGLLFLSAPASGASEVLKQFYDKLFAANGDAIPVYFSVKDSDKTARNSAVRFLQTFITQTIAFRHQDARIIDVAPDICELAELAAPEDGYWIDRLVAACQTESRLNDERAFVRNCLSAPLRAVAYGAKCFVMIDNLHEAKFFSGETKFIEELKEAFSRLNLPFVLAGRRRFLLNAARTGVANLDADVLRVEPLDFTSAGILATNLAAKFDVEINEQTRDLIARQFGGKPAFIKFIFAAASERKLNLDSFQAVERIYAEEIFGGGIGGFYDSIFRKTAANADTRKQIVEVLCNAFKSEEKKSLDDLQTRFNLNDEDFDRLMRLLNYHEIINLNFNRVEISGDNDILNDYVEARFRLEIAAENRAAAVGEMMAKFVKRSPQTMAKFYRQNAAINLREILSAFDYQETPADLIDYAIYKVTRKDADEAEIEENETEKIRLPQIVYTAHTTAFYPPFIKITDETRSAIALGFEERIYTDADEIVWIAAEIESKLEASKETAEFWCDRLEMVALTCNFPKYKIWLIAPEGFAPDASDVLKQRNAFGSSRKQVEQLAEFLGAENADKKSASNEYEIVVPMGADTELIAAHTIEEIARRYNFETKAINQIKTALVEACINATEHSLSPDRKIYQKFTVESDKIIITVSNRGLRLLDKQAREIKPDEGRRGWGLKLMKTLMDEVKIEAVDDGTRISMTKYLK